MKLILAASIAAVALGAREAFRFRLLTSRAGKVTTLAAFVLVFTWLGFVVWGAISQGIGHAFLILVIPFVTGNLARVVLQRVFGGTGLGSDESFAQSVFEHDIARQQSTFAYSLPALQPIISRYRLDPTDLFTLYERIRAQGLSHELALHGIRQPYIVEWYFEHIGKNGRFTMNQSLEFISLVRR